MAIGTKTYWCGKCDKCVTFDKKEMPKCKCGKIFGVSGNISNYINMRKTPSGTTKIEFSEISAEESYKRLKE